MQATARAAGVRLLVALRQPLLLLQQQLQMPVTAAVQHQIQGSTVLGRWCQLLVRLCRLHTS
jgi:hypothetical protein